MSNSLCLLLTFAGGGKLEYKDSCLIYAFHNRVGEWPYPLLAALAAYFLFTDLHIKNPGIQVYLYSGANY